MEAKSREGVNSILVRMRALRVPASAGSYTLDARELKATTRLTPVL